jgi:tellurite methyltransferase
MPSQDADRWNERYADAHSKDFQTPRSFLIDHLHMLPSRGTALDIAMGAGKNTAPLLENGLDVIGIDISSKAIHQAHMHFPTLKAVIADLTQLYLPSNYFDLVLNFYYLQRDLWQQFPRILKPGGLLFIETLTEDMLETKPDLTAEFLLKKGELRQAFSEWDILEYREGWVTGQRGYKKSVASIIARLPA